MIHDGHPHIHVIEKDTNNMINHHHALQLMALELFKKNINQLYMNMMKHVFGSRVKS